MRLILLLLSLDCFAQFGWGNVTVPLIGPPTCCGGTKGSVTNTDPGKPGTGFGAGGGSSGWAGGDGGSAYWLGGGGGGGVGGYGAGGLVGGAGGRGAVVVQYYAPGPIVIGSEIHTLNTTLTTQVGVDSVKFWAVGGGGAGGTASTNDGTNSSGGGAGGVAQRYVTGVTPGTTIVLTIGAGGVPNQTQGTCGGDGGATTVVFAGISTTANGGTKGCYNGAQSGVGGGCSGNLTGGGCVNGGSSYTPAGGDYQGSWGGSIGNATASGDGNDDDGQNAPNPVDVSGLFEAVSKSRWVYQAPNAGLSMIASAPKAAYSFRKLIASYTGPSFRVRRSSDNAEKDIGFNGDNSDIADLKAFVPTGNAYVTTWYNQNTAYANAIQTTTAAQPRIVLNGVPDLSPHSNVLAMWFDQNTYLDTQIGAQVITNAGNEGTVFTVARPYMNSPYSFGVCNDAASDRWMAHFVWGNNSIYLDVGNLNNQRCVTGTTTPYDTWKVWYFVKTNSISYVGWNLTQGCASQNVVQRFTGTQSWYIGWANGNGQGTKYLGWMSEFVVYSSAITGTELDNYRIKTREYYGL